MKQTLLMILAIAVIGSFTSCDKLKEERFSTTVTATVEVNKVAGDPLIVDLDSTISALVNEELAKYQDDIKEYELVSITYKVWEFYGASDAATFTGSIGLGNQNMTEPGVDLVLADISLKAGNDNPNQVNLVINDVETDKINQYFKDTNGLRVFLEGNVSEVPVHFKLAVTVSVDAIAEVKK